MSRADGLVGKAVKILACNMFNTVVRVADLPSRIPYPTPTMTWGVTAGTNLRKIQEAACNSFYLFL